MLLEIRDLHVSVADTDILKGVNLTVGAGEVHAIMGPNGSGKSTLANVIVGRPGYRVTGGDILYDGESVLKMTPDSRALAGIFLAFQYPVELPGVRSRQFLKSALDALREHGGDEALSAREFDKMYRGAVSSVDIGAELMKRGVNEGFSGGEKKRGEMLQLTLLDPRLALPRRDRLGAGHRCPEAGRGNCQPAPQARQLDGPGHPLPTHTQLHHSGLRSRPAGRQDRTVRRTRACYGAGGEGLRVGKEVRPREGGGLSYGTWHR